MALLNRRVLVQYDVGGPVLWHERLPLEHLGVDDYVVVTPDRDIYVEELSVVNSDLRGIRVPARAGAVPAWIAAHEIYGLPNWTAAEMSAIRDEARRIGADERARRAGAPEAGQNPGGGGAPAGGPGLLTRLQRWLSPIPKGSWNGWPLTSTLATFMARKSLGSQLRSSEMRSSFMWQGTIKACLCSVLMGGTWQLFWAATPVGTSGSLTMSSTPYTNQSGPWKRLPPFVGKAMWSGSCLGLGLPSGASTISA